MSAATNDNFCKDQCMQSGTAKSFEKKIALVSGGGDGIGRATAIEFANRGARLIVADIDLSVAQDCLLYTSPSPRDGLLSRMPSSA